MEIKEIGPGDYERVMAIRKPEDVYDGLDYLPDHFDSLFNTPGYKGFAVVWEDKFIAFSFAVCLDNGKTLITRAGRVSKEWEGKGVYKKLDQYIMNKFKKNKEMIFKAVSFAMDNHRMLQKLEEGSINLVMRKEMIGYRSSMELVKQLTNASQWTGDNDIMRFGKKHLEDLFSSRSICEIIFPDDRIVANWVPYRLTTSNVPFILSDHCAIFGWNLQSADKNTGISSVENCRKCVLYHIDLYGKINDDLKNHLLRHLDLLSDKADCEIILLLYVYAEDANKCKEAVSAFGFEKCNLFSKQMICGESKINNY